MPISEIVGQPAQRVASFLTSVNQVMEERIALAWDDLLMAHGLPDGLVDNDDWQVAGLTEASGFGFRVTVTGAALIAAAAGEPHTNMNLTDDQQEARLYLQRIGVRFDDD